MTELRIRQAVRALLVTPDQSVLLVRFEFATATVWALPGGGLEPGEDHLTALRRELIEEVGLHDVAIGAHVWTREHVIPFEDGRWDGQRDVVHVVPTERFEPQPALSWDQFARRTAARDPLVDGRRDRGRQRRSGSDDRVRTTPVGRAAAVARARRHPGVAVLLRHLRPATGCHPHGNLEQMSR